MFKIKPKKGLIIRDPETFELLAEEGEEKPRTSYWLNHLKMAMLKSSKRNLVAKEINNGYFLQ